MSADNDFGDFLKRMRELRGKQPYGEGDLSRRQTRLAHNVWQMHCALLGWRANVVARSFNRDSGASRYLTLDGNLSVSVVIGSDARRMLGGPSLPRGTDWLTIDNEKGRRINFWNNLKGAFPRDSVGWLPDEHEYPAVELNLDKLNRIQEEPTSLVHKAGAFREDLEESLLPAIRTAHMAGVRCDVLGFSSPDPNVTRELQKMWPETLQTPTHVADIETDRLTVYVGLIGAVDWFGRPDDHAHFSDMNDAGYPAWIPIDFWRE